jgi:xanthine dehydrogenase iron-sulfur cluster and FAD-binding subunit A
VRNAATLGGHLALLKARPFQSDVATLLVAAGAQLCLSSAQQGHVWTSVMQLLAPATSVDWHEAVISCLHLPTPRPCSWVWSARQALRRSNAHALVNLALLLQLEEGVEEVEAVSGSAAGQQPAGRLADSVVRSAVIAYGGETASGGWCCGRALQAEQMVAKGQPLTAAALISALEALSADLCPQQPSGYASEALQGLLLQALAPLVDCAQLSLQQPELARLIAGAVPLPPPGLPEGRREVPDFSDAASAPVGAPVAKDGVLLQASGEALYSSDASAAGMLYAAGA